VALVDATRAFVTLYGRNEVAILDIAAGSVEKTIDLASQLTPGDGDGVVEVSTPIHDPTAQRVYVTLARIDRTTIAAPNFELACPTLPALLLALDDSDGSVIDLNGAAAGEGIDLTLENPVDMAFDAATGRLLVLAAGCFGPSEAGTARKGHGVESITLANGQTAIALTPSDASFFARLVHTGGDQALVNSFDPSFAEHWNRWTTSQTSLGAELTAVPAAPSFDGAGNLYGVVFASSDGGVSASVVRYALAGETSTPIVSSPWTDSFSSASGTALVK
jgi:hypothetical protein